MQIPKINTGTILLQQEATLVMNAQRAGKKY